jgi:hypothetical protein
VLLPKNCKKAPACIDYQAYVFVVPQNLEAHVYRQLQKKLIDMGRLRHEMLGVNYVDMEWGLLVIPPMGYEEMKVNFFHHITIKQVEQILNELSRLLNGAGLPGKNN